MPDAPSIHYRLRDLPQDPFELYAAWYERAEAADAIQYPSAMCLSTVDAEGGPQGRFVIAHRLEKAFVFLTDSRSPKARALAADRRAALTAYWGWPLENQVRIEGEIDETSAATNDMLFEQRPKGSQATPWASRQSEVTSLDRLEDRLAEIDRKWADSDSLPRPEHWVGYRLLPSMFEFWAARPRRLHDRFRYTRRPGGDWDRVRLAP